MFHNDTHTDVAATDTPTLDGCDQGATVCWHERKANLAQKRTFMSTKTPKTTAGKNTMPAVLLALKAGIITSGKFAVVSITSRFQHASC